MILQRLFINKFYYLGSYEDDKKFTRFQDLLKAPKAKAETIDMPVTATNVGDVNLKNSVAIAKLSENDPRLDPKYLIELINQNLMNNVYHSDHDKRLIKASLAVLPKKVINALGSNDKLPLLLKTDDGADLYKAIIGQINEDQYIADAIRNIDKNLPILRNTDAYYQIPEALFVLLKNTKNSYFVKKTAVVSKEFNDMLVTLYATDPLTITSNKSIWKEFFNIAHTTDPLTITNNKAMWIKIFDGLSDKETKKLVGIE